MICVLINLVVTGNTESTSRLPRQVPRYLPSQHCNFINSAAKIDAEIVEMYENTAVSALFKT